MKAVFEKEALEEYIDAAHYSEKRFGLGTEFVNAVQEAIDMITSDPLRFQQVGPSVHLFRMKRFPFYLFYHHLAGEESVTIYAVAHHSRKPDYWRKRIK